MRKGMGRYLLKTANQWWETGEGSLTRESQGQHISPLKHRGVGKTVQGNWVSSSPRVPVSLITLQNAGARPAELVQS
jgi:hypothetical protein